MALNSATVSSGDDILATDHNTIREDVLYGVGDYVTATGSSNAYAISVDSQLTSLSAGQVFRFVANHTNDDAATLNVNTLGAVDIEYQGLPLPPRSIVSGQVIICVYDGSNMQLLSGFYKGDWILFDKLSWSNESTSKGTGILTDASNVKMWRVLVDLEWTGSRTGQARMTMQVNGITSSSYVSGGSTYWIVMGDVSSGGSSTKYGFIDIFISNIHHSNVMRGAQNCFQDGVTINTSFADISDVDLGSDTYIDEFNFSPLDTGAGAFAMTGDVKIFGLY